MEEEKVHLDKLLQVTQDFAYLTEDLKFFVKKAEECFGEGTITEGLKAILRRHKVNI